MYFVDLEQAKPRELAPGVKLHAAWGDKLMLSLVKLVKGSQVPMHKHPHEQAGIVLEGQVDFVIGKERRLLKKGDAYIIPGNVEHGIPVVPVAAVVLDIFSPPREEYKS